MYTCAYVVIVYPWLEGVSVDTPINVDRWIAAAEEEISLVDGALCALGANQTTEGIEIHDLANLDVAGIAAYLKRLAERLQAVATNLIHLADNADLTDIVESLEVPPTTPVRASSSVPSVGDTGPAITTTRNPPAKVDNPVLEGKTVEELFDMLEALDKGDS
jgi:hypothetical protein